MDGLGELGRKTKVQQKSSSMPPSTISSICFINTPCPYKHISECGQVKEAAFSNAGTVWDEASYEILQLGVMLSSGRVLNSLLTASGIVVEDEFFYKYLMMRCYTYYIIHNCPYHTLHGNRLSYYLPRLSTTEQVRPSI